MTILDEIIALNNRACSSILKRQYKDAGGCLVPALSMVKCALASAEEANNSSSNNNNEATTMLAAASQFGGDAAAAPDHATRTSEGPIRSAQLVQEQQESSNKTTTTNRIGRGRAVTIAFHFGDDDSVATDHAHMTSTATMGMFAYPLYISSIRSSGDGDAAMNEDDDGGDGMEVESSTDNDGSDEDTDNSSGRGAVEDGDPIVQIGFSIIFNLSLISHLQAMKSCSRGDERHRALLAQKALTLYNQAQMLLLHHDQQWGDEEDSAADLPFLPVVAVTMNIAHIYRMMGCQDEAFDNYRRALGFLATLPSVTSFQASVEESVLYEHFYAMVLHAIQDRCAVAAAAA